MLPPIVYKINKNGVYKPIFTSFTIVSPTKRARINIPNCAIKPLSDVIAIIIHIDKNIPVITIAYIPGFLFIF
jgi:hypothetical protein